MKNKSVLIKTIMFSIGFSVIFYIGYYEREEYFFSSFLLATIVILIGLLLDQLYRKIILKKINPQDGFPYFFAYKLFFAVIAAILSLIYLLFFK